MNIAVRSVNDAPTVRGGLALQHVDDDMRIRPFARMTIGDVDRPAQNLRVRVEMDDLDKGDLTEASLEASGFTFVRGGFEFRGTASEATEAIRMLVFDPTNDRVERGTFEVTSFTVIVDDGLADLVIDDSTSIASLRPNRVPVLASIATLQGSAATQSFTITYEMLLEAADVTDDDRDPIVFRIGEVQEGTLTKDGQAVLAGQTLLSEGESVVWTSMDGVKRTRPAFDVQAFDGEDFSATRTVRVYVRFDSDAAAADDADVEIASTFEGVLTVVSRSSSGRLIILQQEDPSGPWTRISALDGVEGVDDTITWVDEGVTYVGFTLDGTFRTIRNVDGTWIERNVTEELSSGHAIEGTLTTF
ncbi:MAG: hypothetical protein KDA28_09475, partial [Phycisphaerales bacterium]|nr:hypothetical protein [Phycisphaerales bacterium]